MNLEENNNYSREEQLIISFGKEICIQIFRRSYKGTQGLFSQYFECCYPGSEHPIVNSFPLKKEQQTTTINMSCRTS